MFTFLQNFLDKHGQDMLQATIEHVHLTAMALFAAIFLALPLGIALTRCPVRSIVSAVMGTAGIVQTIPTLAFVAMIVLVFALVGLPAIGTVPALAGLVMYALLPILRNTYTGIRQVDKAIIEVATGMGMRPSQILFKIELPLALPFIMAGIRISTVWTIGIATLGAFIGAGGLGDLIIQGLQNSQMDYVLAGTLPAAALALVLDYGLGQCEKHLTPNGMLLEHPGATA